MDFEDIIGMGDVCEKFCEGCAAIWRIPGGLEEPDDYECEACSWDMSSSDCLKYDAYCRIQDAVEMINDAIEEEGSYCCD